MADFSVSFSLPDVTVNLSPNYGPRVGGGVDGPDMIVLHYTGMASGDAALKRLCDPSAAVSAHYLVDVDGQVLGLVPEIKRAWHAGRSFWKGDADVNSRSIGIELDHAGHRFPASSEERVVETPPPFSEIQMSALERLLAAIQARWAIRPERVVGHSDVAPGRKIDPGESFDWSRLAAAGLVVDPPASSREETAATADEAVALFTALKRIGYGDWPRAALLDATRRRYHRNHGVKPTDRSLTRGEVVTLCSFDA